MKGKETTPDHTAPRTVLVLGYAKLPEDTASHALYGSVGIALEIERDFGTIMAVDCTLAPDLANDFLGRLLQGKRLPEDLELCAAEIASRFLGPSQSALVAALRAANDRWESYRASEM